MKKEIYDKYKELILEFFDSELKMGNDLKEVVLNFLKRDKLILLWGSFMYGRLCTDVHNYIINKISLDNILKDFDEYNNFEDGMWEIFKDIANEWKNKSENA